MRISIAYNRYGWEVDPILCIYCGSPKSIQQDHVPPVSRRDDFRLLGGDVFMIVPACQSCNSILGDCLTLTIEDRKEVLIARLMDKFIKIVKPKDAEWTVDEWLELGPNLSSVVINNVKGRHNSTANDLLDRVNYNHGISECVKYIKKEKHGTVVCLLMEKEMIKRISRKEYEDLNAQGLAYSLNHKITRFFLKRENLTIKPLSS